MTAPGSTAATTEYLLPVAIIDEVPNSNQLVVWHVDLNPTAQLGRLPGAWVIDRSEADAFGPLRGGRHTVHLPADEPRSGDIDLTATIAAMTAEVEHLEALFQTHVSTAKGKLVRPAWPEIIDPRSSEAGVIDIGPCAPECVRALQFARELAALANAWEQIEGQRLVRPALAKHTGSTARPMPISRLR